MHLVVGQSDCKWHARTARLCVVGNLIQLRKTSAWHNSKHRKRSTRPHGSSATMGYSWEQHRQTCYRLYVEENRPLDEVVRYMREHHDFTPR